MTYSILLLRLQRLNEPSRRLYVRFMYPTGDRDENLECQYYYCTIKVLVGWVCRMQEVERTHYLQTPKESRYREPLIGGDAPVGSSSLPRRTGLSVRILYRLDPADSVLRVDEQVVLAYRRTAQQIGCLSRGCVPVLPRTRFASASQHEDVCLPQLTDTRQRSRDFGDVAGMMGTWRWPQAI